MQALEEEALGGRGRSQVQYQHVLFRSMGTTEKEAVDYSTEKLKEKEDRNEPEAPILFWATR